MEEPLLGGGGGFGSYGGPLPPAVPTLMQSSHTGFPGSFSSLCRGHLARAYRRRLACDSFLLRVGDGPAMRGRDGRDTEKPEN
jgi:hypothetical protein